MAMELVWPYVASDPSPTVTGYLNWVKNQQNELYKLKYEQVLVIYNLIIANIQKKTNTYFFFRSFCICKP